MVFLIAAPPGAPHPPKKAACLPALLTFMAGWDSAASPALILGEVVPVSPAALASSLPSLSSHLLHTPDLLITGHHTPRESSSRHALCCFLPSCLLRTSAQTLSLWSPSLPPTFPALPSCLPFLSNRADRPPLEHTLHSSNGSVSSFWPGTVPSPELVLSPDSTHALMLLDASGENPERMIGLSQLPKCFWCCSVVWVHLSAQISLPLPQVAISYLLKPSTPWPSQLMISLPVSPRE